MGVSAGKQKRDVNEGNLQRKGGRLRLLFGRKKTSPSTTLYDLPLEILDVILQKSYLHWILSSSANLKDEEFIRRLILVDVCFNRRIARQRFKKAIWRYLRDRRWLLFGIKEAPPRTKLYDLPMEMLDVILQKSYLHWILNTKTKQRNEEVIRSLISVDVCFNRRITRQRFKKTIWHFLKNFYENTMKISAVIRNNRNYLLKTIQPNNKFISSLLSLNCVTEEQCYCIQRQSSKQDKNAELLEIMRSFTMTKFSNLVQCLRQTNQTEVARIVSKGGVVLKVTVKNCGRECTDTEFTQIIHQRMNDLRNGINTCIKSHKTNKCVSQLVNEGMEILNTQQTRQTVVVWIWCRTQAALEHIQDLYESNQMREVFFDRIPSSISILIRIQRNQFKKTAVLYPISIKFNFPQRIELLGNHDVCGVIKLRNEIFVLLGYLAPSVIRVFEDRNPFSFRRKINVNQIKEPFHIESSEKENCLYVSDSVGRCIWKITNEKGDEHKVMKWLNNHHGQNTFSVSIDGNLLMINEYSPFLMIYGSDAALIRSMHLPTEIENPIHAVETSIENFIILHFWTEKTGRWSSVRDRERNYVVSELTRDGQEVIRRFIPAHQAQELIYPRYVSLDSNDRVFVIDGKNDRIILLESDLEWNQIICKLKEGSNLFPWRMCYDKENKQLIVVGRFQDVTIYTLSQN